MYDPAPLPTGEGRRVGGLPLDGGGGEVSEPPVGERAIPPLLLSNNWLTAPTPKGESGAELVQDDALVDS